MIVVVCSREYWGLEERRIEDGGLNVVFEGRL